MGKVYLIATDDDQYKIGMTNGTVNERIEQLQVGNGNEIYFVNEFETRHFKRVEKWVHRVYANKRIEGEWFELTEEDVADFTKHCQKGHDIYETLIQSGNPFI